jgi:hypothetical protein
MANTDLTGVRARRVHLTRELVQVERKRVELLAEDDELGLTENVLRRLGRLGVADRPATPPAAASAAEAQPSWLRLAEELSGLIGRKK